MSIRPAISPTPRWPVTGALISGGLALLALVAGLGWWSVSTTLAGAVIAPGTVEREEARRLIEHPEGGLVASLSVAEGDVVRAGQALLQLDDTFVGSELLVVERQLMELFALRARLEAERDGAEALSITPPSGFERLDPGWMGDQLRRQEALFATRLAAFRAEGAARLEETRAIAAERDGLAAQTRALAEELAIVEAARTDLERLVTDGLAPLARLRDVERERAALAGLLGQAHAARAAAESRLIRAHLLVDQLTTERREQAITQLRDLRFGAIELEVRRLALAERLQRLEIRAPVAGTVFGLSVAAEGTVVDPGAPILALVSADTDITVSVRVRPSDVDQVYAGQPVTLQFSAFDQRTTPPVAGEVSRLSAEPIPADPPAEPFFEVIVRPDTAALSDAGLTLLPGMPVEALLRTSDRRPLDYFIEPLSLYFSRALREG